MYMISLLQDMDVIKARMFMPSLLQNMNVIEWQISLVGQRSPRMPKDSGSIPDLRCLHAVRIRA